MTPDAVSEIELGTESFTDYSIAWLAFGAIAYAGLALLRGRQSVCALVGCAATALLVNHLFDTGW